MDGSFGQVDAIRIALPGTAASGRVVAIAHSHRERKGPISNNATDIEVRWRPCCADFPNLRGPA
jgi:hypothetical protein